MPGYNATYSFTSVVPWPAAGSGRHIARPTRGRPDAAEITVPLNVVTSVRPTDVILRAPRHPYARVLIGAVPPVDPARSGTRPRPSPRPDRSLGHRTQLTVGDRRGMARTLRQWSRDKPRRSIPGTRSQPDTRSRTPETPDSRFTALADGPVSGGVEYALSRLYGPVAGLGFSSRCARIFLSTVARLACALSYPSISASCSCDSRGS